jgi:8-oxo-dGTP pyrophosphatase MutT (NUDIX family)
VGAPNVETSAGGVIFRWSGNEPWFLLIRDAYQRWGLPKGHIEEGETPEAAALREVEEETGLTDLRLGKFVETVDWHFSTTGGRVHKFCHFFLIEASTGEPTPRLEEGITACRWLRIADAAAQISYPNTREVLVRAAAELGYGVDGVGASG